MSDRIRCIAQVWKRDTYRYCGGKPRYRMHYNRCQCRRLAKLGTEFCAQHTALQQFGTVMICAWAERLAVPPPNGSGRTENGP